MVTRAAPPSSDIVIDEIRRIVATKLDVARAVEPTDDLLVDLQLDSLMLLTLVVDLEDRFRIKITDEDAAEVRTVADLAQLIARRAHESPA